MCNVPLCKDSAPLRTETQDFCKKTNETPTNLLLLVLLTILFSSAQLFDFLRKGDVVMQEGRRATQLQSTTQLLPLFGFSRKDKTANDGRGQGGTFPFVTVGQGHPRPLLGNFAQVSMVTVSLAAAGIRR